jgi:hypothetical protein
MRTSLLLPIVAAAALLSGCVTHATRSVMQTTAGVAPLTQAEVVLRSRGYTLGNRPPISDSVASRNARRAWRWWPGNAWSEGSGYNTYTYGGRQARRAFWIRPRADGGWDQLAITTFWANSGRYGQPGDAVYWSRWVVHAGTFGVDGKERWPSREVRADADTLIAAIWHAQRSEGKTRAG